MCPAAATHIERRDAREVRTAMERCANRAMTLDVRTKRVYDPAEPCDGQRVLIDHVWPRGVTRERARLDEWARDLAPSDELRKWFDHVPERFGEFRSRYRERARRPARTRR